MKDSLKIVYYKSYKELNEYLHINGHDIILDHQLYWFDISISHVSFLNIRPNKIIYIIHGVPLHFEDISKRNFYYSIELYIEYASHISWNNHIKIYNNIGVNTEHIDNIPKKYIFGQIAIVGRIDNHKIPVNFLKTLINFSNTYKQYTFNFYGICDENYKNYFLTNINKSSNLIYHGIIDPKDISNIYINNDILLHPSKSEAGATVILEAMSYGLPIICRNVGGSGNALSKVNASLLARNDIELFNKLLMITSDNYTEISSANIEKILSENNDKKQMTKLIDDIKLIYDIESLELSSIPNIVHYIFGLIEDTCEFQFVYYLSILSNVLINKPQIIYFHYQYMPHGAWWDKAKKYVKLNFINADSLKWGKKKILKYAHKADKIRLDILLKYGGIYMDIDTITYRPYKDLLKYDFVMGIQDDSNPDAILYCNAILLAKRDNIFIKRWIDKYEEYFVTNGWCEASVNLPHIILKDTDLLNIKIVDKECFYYPSYNETEKIFEEDEDIHPNLITLHLWDTFSHKYYKNIKDFNWDGCDSLYKKIMDNLLNYSV